MLAHIRRNDEVNITYCGRLTAYDATMQPVVTVGADIAVFDDAEPPAGSSTCPACWSAYTRT